MGLFLFTTENLDFTRLSLMWMMKLGLSTIIQKGKKGYRENPNPEADFEEKK